MNHVKLYKHLKGTLEMVGAGINAQLQNVPEKLRIVTLPVAAGLIQQALESAQAEEQSEPKTATVTFTAAELDALKNFYELNLNALDAIGNWESRSTYNATKRAFRRITEAKERREKAWDKWLKRGGGK